MFKIFKSKKHKPIKSVDGQVYFIHNSELMENVWRDASENDRLPSGKVYTKAHWVNKKFTCDILKTSNDELVRRVTMTPNNIGSWVNYINEKPKDTPVSVSYGSSEDGMIIHCIYGASTIKCINSNLSNEILTNIIRKQNSNWFNSYMVHPNALSSAQKQILKDESGLKTGKPLRTACKKYGVLYCNSAKNIISNEVNSRFWMDVLANGGD